MSPTSPAEGISTPSYRDWATIIVRYACIFKIFEASCCSLEVVNGAGAKRLRSFLFTSRTTKGPFSTAARSAAASSPLRGRTFFPPASVRRAGNGGGHAAENRAVSDQYSSGTKASISFSLAQRIFTATDWTLPAESPRRTFFHRSGERVYPTSRSRIRRACWASNRFGSSGSGFAIPWVIPFLVISWKSTRRISGTDASEPAAFFAAVFPKGFFPFPAPLAPAAFPFLPRFTASSRMASAMCQAIASPSRSGSGARYTASEERADSMMSPSTFFRSFITT